MALINVYTRKAGETATEREKVPVNLSALPGSKFLPKRKKLADKSVGFPTKIRKCVPGSKWSTGSGSDAADCVSDVNTVTVDYVTDFGGSLFVSFTDFEGNPTGYTAIGKFLSQYPLPVEVQRDESKRKVAAEESGIDPATGKRNAINLGSFV